MAKETPSSDILPKQTKRGSTGDTQWQVAKGTPLTTIPEANNGGRFILGIRVNQVASQVVKLVLL